MKIWKKALLGTSVLVAGLALAACGSNSSSDSSSGSSTSKGVSGTVKLWVDTTKVPYYKPELFMNKQKYGATS